MIRSGTSAFWALVMVNIIWGAGFVVIDKAIDIVAVNTFNTLRFGLAALCLLPLWWASKERANFSGHGPVLKVGFGLGLLLFLGFSTQTQGMLYTSVSNAGFITGLCVPLTPVIAFLLFRKHVDKAVWISVALATAGLYMLTVGDKLEFNSGDILITICAICFASHICFTDRYADRYPVVLLSVYQLAAVGVYSAIAAVFGIGETRDYPPLMEQLTNNIVIQAVLYSAILGSAFAYWAQTSSQRLLEPHKVALVFALEPIFAHLFAYIFLDEHLGFKGWIGAGLIISAMLYAELGGRRKAKMQPLDQTSSPSLD
ncbi:DMT family transporter [Pseudoteredinibacter isoporae]|uniref:Drug/metabolite transporter (DMT)-like permease n=1 Tax=Pseudoteredinibacter isoporae TaxID=570281 RepID=A0A7X0JR47_9GAMM|nr:DMT family transporter [Pseudoteredinibacter isoporae]MBB6519851.1 drug/metabolite transporter (DMT)-like permease [Pseudoteredinibacter isoporae]NHO85430.1 DMT family transporter [Pseudoteredinibacter isoporae]NIB26118.1 DMT family transporter [Pseudoteredinibacter isoporae]